MLLLQLKDRAALKLPKKAIFLIKLSFFCFSLHALALVLFFLFPDSRKTIFLDMVNNNNATLIFVPLLKTNAQPQKSNHIDSTHSQQEKSTAQKKQIISAPAKKIEPKKEQSKKLVVKKPQPIKKDSQKKVMQDKKIPSAQKSEPKKVEPEKKIIKNEENKIIKQKEQPEKIEPEKNRSIVTQEPSSKQKAVPAEVTQLVGRDDMDLINLSNVLKQDILKKWKRPANIPTKLVCEARVKINKDGSKDVIIEKASSALALDMSARNFLLNYDFPQEAYGKEVAILF